MSRYTIREAVSSDVAALSRLFVDTVLAVNRRDYSAEEVADWASCDDDEARWMDLIARFRVSVAEDAQAQMVGFAAISKEGYLDYIFVHKDFQGQGLASLLLGDAETYASEQGAARITSEVSITARPFFEQRGYRVIRQQQRRAKNLLLTNFVMEKVK